MTIGHDFFFGEYRKGRIAPTLYLTDAAKRSSLVSTSFFTSQLNRLLSNVDGHIVLSNETSHPPFWNFFQKLDINQIGFIEIYSRNDINQNVNATLACDIVLSQGILSVTTHWCAWKELRAEEIVNSLLVPLHLRSMQHKSYTRSEDGKRVKLVTGNDYEKELTDIFSLAKYPDAMTWGNTPDQLKTMYTHMIQCATEVSEENIPPENAWDSFVYKLRDNKSN